MTKGKKKPLVVERRLEHPCKNKVDREAKENKNEIKRICQEQQTLHTFINPSNPRPPHRNNPLFPIPEENASTFISASNARKHGEASLTLELKTADSLTKDNSDAHPSSFETKEKTVTVLEEHGTEHATFSNQSEPRNHTKARSTQKKAENKTQHNRKVTDYYPIRRSSRKSKAELKSEEQHRIDDLITNNVEDGLKVEYIEGKGRGVFADKEFRKGQFVVEYHGDLLQIDDAKDREAQYAQDPTKGCYMYYFRYLNISYCVDATKETDRLGRLINHSKNGNCQTKVHNINGVPHLILVASRDIKVEEELLYDYGDRSKEAIAAHPWLKD